MAKIFCIANQKGGVGKTTTALNLAAALALRGKRVLFVDMDSQGNGTMGAGVDKLSLSSSNYELLCGKATFHETVMHAEGGFDVLPANRQLSLAEVELVRADDGELRLKRVLDTFGSAYDYILIDCPPSLSMMTLNALCCADGVFIPMQCEYFALEGLSDLCANIRRIHALKNRKLKTLMLLRVMFDPRMTLQQQVSEQLVTHFGDKVFETIIPRNVRLAEAPSYGQPGVLYDQNSKGSKAYMACADELIRRVEGRL